MFPTEAWQQLRGASQIQTPPGVSSTQGAAGLRRLWRELGTETREASGPGKGGLPCTGAKESMKTTKLDPYCSEGKRTCVFLAPLYAICNKN